MNEIREFVTKMGGNLKEIVVSEEFYDVLAAEIDEDVVIDELGAAPYQGIVVDGCVVRWSR